nr:ribonuclease H-like domain, reverse transcriptase, RNA-dependent DNA polymerase [Tanacetum cinerariifolium]
MFIQHESKGKYFRGSGRGKHKFSQGKSHEKLKEEMKDKEYSHRNFNRNNFKKSSYDTSKLQCYQCKKIGHIAPNCPQRTKANEQSNLVEEDLEPTLLMAILEDSDEGNQVKEVEEQKVSLHEEDVGYKETNMDSQWYLDNGASNHMTGVREHFKELDEKVSGKVRFGDGSYIEIKGKVPSQCLTKLDDRSIKMVYLGNEQGSKAYRLFDPITQKICVSKDVKNKENKTWDWKEYISEHINDEPEWIDFKIENLEVTSEHHDQGTQPIEEDNKFPNNDADGYVSPTTGSPLHSQSPHTPSTSSSQVNSQVTPNISTQSIYQNNSDQEDVNGNIIKHKARLVAKGYIQEHGIDFEEVFAPVARMETIRLLLALTANNKWKVHHLDVKSAFLHRDLKEEVYVTHHEEFIKREDNAKVYRLIKALYGIKQAPRAWNIKLDNTLKSLDFNKSELEQAIYTKISRHSTIIVGVYVDDLIITDTPKKEIDKFKAQMEEKFEMSNLGLLAYYLGIKFTQTGSDISIKQSAYANKILKEAGMIDCNETLIPMDLGTRLTKINVPKLAYGFGFILIVEYGADFVKASGKGKAKKAVRLLYNERNHYDLLV